MIISTPSGFNVTLKDKISFGALEKMQMLFTEGMKVAPTKITTENFQLPEVEVNKMFEYRHLALKALLVSIEKEGQVVNENVYEYFVDEFDPDEAKPVVEAVMEIVKKYNASKTPAEVKKN